MATLYEYTGKGLFQFSDDSFGDAVGDASQSTGAAVNIFTRTVDDELIDWANKVDISVPNWAKNVEVLVLGKSGQSGADNNLYMRVNNDSGNNYAGHRTVVTNATVTGSVVAPQGFIIAINLLDTEPTARLFRGIVYPKNHGIYPAIEQVASYSDAGTDTKIEAVHWWQNTADDISTINLFTVNSTKVSCVITVSAWS